MPEPTNQKLLIEQQRSQEIWETIESDVDEQNAVRQTNYALDSILGKDRFGAKTDTPYAAMHAVNHADAMLVSDALLLLNAKVTRLTEAVERIAAHLENQ